MTAVSYRLELDELRHPVLIKEQDTNYDVEPFTQPEKIVALCDEMMRLRYLAEENMIMVAVDTQNAVLGIFKVSQGIVDMTICNPREIFIRAFLVGAGGIFLVHNHPSGSCKPSKLDLQCAKRIEEVGKLIGIRLVDFIVVGKESFYSARSDGDIL